jgi:hypothetical protein
MTPAKAVSTTARKTASENTPTAQAATTSTRRPWIKKTPVEVVLDQIRKQEEKVSELREDLTREERELSKLQQAKKILEST